MHDDSNENDDYDFMINNNETTTSKLFKYKIKITKSSEKSTIVADKNGFKYTEEKNTQKLLPRY